jgi:uncharacterized membrane protein YccC
MAGSTGSIVDEKGASPGLAASEHAIGPTIALRRFLGSRSMRRATRVALVLPLTLWGFVHLGEPMAGFNAAFALVCLLVLSDLTGPRRERASSLLLIGAAGAVSLALGALLSAYPVALVIAALLLGFAVTILGVLRGFVSSATVPILLPFFLAATTPNAARNLLTMEAGWLIGTVLSILSVVLLWPYFPPTKFSDTLTSLLRVQSHAVDTLWQPNATRHDQVAAVGAADEPAQALESLFRGELKRPGSAYRRERTMLRLFEEVRRLRLALRLVVRQGTPQCFAEDSQLARDTAQALNRAAELLPTHTGDLTTFEGLQQSRDDHWRSVERSAARMLAEGDADAVKKRVSAAFSVRMLSLMSLPIVRDAPLTNAPPRTRIPDTKVAGVTVPSVVSVIHPWRQVQSELNPAAPWFRNALRLGLAIALALVVVELTGVERGYWVVLATLSVLRLDRKATGLVAGKVFVGQLIGFALGAAMLLVLHAHPQLAWVTLPFVVGLAGYVTGTAGTIVSQVVFTATLINLVAISLPNAKGISELRLLDAMLGLVVAVVVSLLILPRGVTPQVESSLREAMDSAVKMLRASVSRFAAMLSGERDLPEVTGETTAALVALERATETLDLALSQGSGRGAPAVIKSRIISLIEHVIFVAEVLGTQVYSYPGGIQSRRVAGDLVAATDAIVRRMSANANRLLAQLDGLPVDAVIPEPLALAEPLPELEHARRTISREVDTWSEQRRADMAAPLTRLYWTLQWLEEIDMIAGNVGRVSAALSEQG